MSISASEMTPADIAAVTNNNCGRNGDGFGWGGDWTAWIILFLIFGMFGFGNGGWGGGFGGGRGAGSAVDGYVLTSDFANIERKIDGVNNGLCDGFYNMNSALLNGFHGTDNAICSLGYQTQQGFNQTNMGMMQGFNGVERGQADLARQNAECCCNMLRGIDGINYNMAQQTCGITNAINNSTRDIIDNQNQNSRAILDYLCQDKIATLQQENQALRLAASQSSQNAFIRATMEANTAEIIRRTGNECPVPAYIVQSPQPLTFPTNGCGQVQLGGYGCCGGCGSY